MIILFDKFCLCLSAELKFWDKFIYLNLSKCSYVLSKLNIVVSLESHCVNTGGLHGRSPLGLLRCNNPWEAANKQFSCELNMD